MKKSEIMPGQMFDDWVVVEELPPRQGHRYFKVRCTRDWCAGLKCGAEIEVELNNLKKLGKVKCFKCKPVNRKTYFTLMLRPVGRVTPLGVVKGRGESAVWVCICKGDPGNKKLGRPAKPCGRLCSKDTVTLLQHLRRGSKSFLNCGCFRATRRFDHGMSGTLMYKAYQAMKRRCNDPDAKDYGARGIEYEERWNSFPNYFDDKGQRPEGKTLDRIDPNGPYSKENTRWATPKEQSRNKRNNHSVIFEGKEYIVATFAEKIKMPAREVSRLLKKEWMPEAIAFYAGYDNPPPAYQSAQNHAAFDAVI